MTDLITNTADSNRNTFTCVTFSECTGRLDSRRLDDLGLWYECKYWEPDNEYKIRWTVNGVDVHSYQSQFDIKYLSTVNTRSGFGISATRMLINNPVYLRGPTEIKCTVVGVSGFYKTWQMNSKILVNIDKC